MSDPSSRQMETANSVMAPNAAQLVTQLVTLGGRMGLDLEIINSHTEQIDFLKKEIQEKNEAISRMNKDLKDVREQNDDLKITVESKNREIKALKDKIDKLETEKKVLETKLRSVEVELEAVRKDFLELKTANNANEEKNVILEEKVEKLSKKMDGMKQSLQEARGENTSLQKKVQDLEQAVQRKQPFGVPERMALPFLSDPVEGASLILGELCWRIQAMMYEKVHPNSYDHKKSYKIKHIEEDIDELDDEEHKREAKKRWADLKKKLKWKGRRHARAMKSIQESRNMTAHPELSEQMLVSSAGVMEKAGKLTDWHDSACVQELIEMWKKLQQKA